MRNIIDRHSLLVALTLIGLALAPARARADIEVARADAYELSIGGMAQLLALGQTLDDPFKSGARAYLFLQEARLRVMGRYDRVRFHLEVGLGGEDVVAAPNPGVSLALLDFSIDIPLGAGDATYLRLGQFKVPYGRERLAYSGDLQFDGRSIETLGFNVGRDVGIALVAGHGPVTFVAGVFTGGGRDLPALGHELPEELGFPLLVARLGVGNLEEDPFATTQTAFELDRVRGAFNVNGMFTRDSLVGHSTVLNVKLADKSLLLDANWNPYISRAPMVQGNWWQLGADGVVRVPAGKFILAGELQADWAGYQNDYGVVHIAGGRAQASALRGAFELAVRYAVLFPDKNFSNVGIPLTGDAAIHEISPALSWFIKGESLKVVLDAPVFVNDVVFLENEVGAYVGTEQPAQAAVVSRGSVQRQNVFEARAMFQARF